MIFPGSSTNSVVGCVLLKMGNGSTKNVQAILDTMAATIVKVNQSCLASAGNLVLIDIMGADNVLLQNLDITQSATASADCVLLSDVSVASTVANVTQALDNLVSQIHGSKAPAPLFNHGIFDTSVTDTKVTNRIATTLTKQVLSTCLANAVNAYKLVIHRLGGNVTIRDMDITQVAVAQVTRCVSQIHIQTDDGSGQPLNEYIKEKLADGTIVMRPSSSATHPRVGLMVIGAIAGAATVTAIVAGIAMPVRKR